MLAINERELSEVETRLGGVLRCDAGKAALVSALAAEHMRYLIYGCSSGPQTQIGFLGTVHTTRLLSCARRAINLVWPEYSRQAPPLDVCLATLKRMEALGDTVNLGAGQWIAAPLRMVQIDKDDGCFFVGAAPTEPILLKLGVPTICAGVSRFVGPRACETARSKDLLQSVDSWLGEMPALADWTSWVITDHETRMVEIAGLSAEQLEIYAPDVAVSQRRHGRWISASQIGRPLEGVRLCRPQECYAQSWDRPWYLAHFHDKKGVLTLRRAASISYELTLRLRFGLDEQLKVPRVIAIARHNGTFSIDRPLTLPTPENRVYALGWQEGASADSDNLTFLIDALPVVVRCLQRLSINPTIIDRNTP